MNTFDPALAADRDGRGGYHVVRRVPVVTTTLKQILDDHVPPGTAIDFLTVDVEGFDLRVLRSNDWDRYTPAVVLAEDAAATRWAEIGSSPTARFLGSHGYEPFAKTPRTTFYRR